MGKTDQLSLSDLLQLLQTNERLLLAGNRQKLLDFILDEAIRLGGAERGFIILTREGAQEIASARSLDKETLRRAQEKFSQTVFRQVMETGEPLLSVDAEKDPLLGEAESIMEMQLTSVLCVPIRLADQPLGVLYLDNRFTEGAFQENQVQLLNLFAGQAALAINALESLSAAETHASELARLQGQLTLLNEGLQTRTQRAEQERDQAQALLGNFPSRKGFEGILGSSRAMAKLLRTIERIQDTEVTVYLHGESGTGKELIARALHQRSPRRAKPFVALNCAAFSEHLLDSELFGHVRGAFTGAERERRGLFEEAQGGTILLDEVGEMGPGMQAKLLRVLQEREIRPVGSNQSKKIDVRVVAATHRDLSQLVKEKKFREDLFYRLNVLRLDLPPLRERREDIPELVRFFMEKNTLGIPPECLALDPLALRRMVYYPWPGNIRELQNEVQRCLILGKGRISPDLLSSQVHGRQEPVASERTQLKEQLREVERRSLTQALETSQGNKEKAATSLGISRAKLYQLLQRHRLGSDYGRITDGRIRKTLRELKGNKTLAAQRLGLPRRTLYDRLKKM